MRAPVLVLLAASLGWQSCQQRQDETPVPILTAQELDSIEPSARTELEAARETARRRPDDPDAHGRLAMLLHAHGFLEAAASSYHSARILAPEEARWPRLDAHRAAEAGEENEALEHAARAVELEADSVAARTTLAQLESRGTRLEEARGHFQAALAREPDNFTALRGMGMLEVRNGNFVEAVRFLERALAVDPDDPSAHYTAALALNRLGETARAEEHLAASRRGPARRPAIEPPAEILALRGRGVRAILAAGTELLDRGLYDEAVLTLREALAAEPESADAHNALGAALEQAGDPEAARLHYEEAVALEPELAVVRQNLGVLLGRLGELDRAVGQLEEAVRLDPGQAEAHFALGVALEAQGRANDALAALRNAVSRNPRMARAHVRLGALLGAEAQVGEALVHLERAIELEPASGEAHHYLSVALHRLGNTAEAMEHERRAITLAEVAGSSDLLGTAHYTLATMLQTAGQLAEALPHLQKALAHYPDSTEVLSELARNHHLQGNHGDAIAVQRRVIAARPADADAHYRLGVFLAASGDRARALGAFQDSLRAAPGFAPALEAIERLRGRDRERSSPAGYGSLARMDARRSSMIS